MRNECSLENVKECDFAIIGANISGALMAYRLEQHFLKNIVIFEECSRNIRISKADKVPFYINRIVDIPKVQWKKVQISMKIWNRGEYFYKSNEDINRNYAKKITGGICPTTIERLQPRKDIFVPVYKNCSGRQTALLSMIYDNLNSTNIMFGTQIVNIDIESRIIVDAAGDKYKYKYLISTIPMRQFLSCTKMDEVFCLPCLVKSFYIDVKRSKSDGEYQVIYCPDQAIRINRVACLNKDVYIEATENLSNSTLNNDEKNFLESISYMFEGENFLLIIWSLFVDGYR